MRMLDRVLRRLMPLRIVDPVLGTLRFRSEGFWEGRRVFEPASREVEFILEAGETGPLEGHRRFFDELVQRYPELWARVEPMLRRELHNFPSSPTRFEVERFSIPDPDADPAYWEIVYTSESAADHYFRVTLEGWEPTGFSVDD